MMKLIDDRLNKITMYRLILYCLLALWTVGLVFSFFGVLAYQPLDFFFSGVIILFVSWLTNEIFAYAFEAPVNLESVYITAFILALIISPLPPTATNFYDKFWFLIIAAVWAIASKFIFAIREKHLFNPAALSVVLTALLINQSASWWIGTAAMLPFVLIVGLLITRKMRRFDLVFSFLAVAVAGAVFSGLSRGTAPLTSLLKLVLNSPLLFFAFIMLTEPLTTPPTSRLRLSYGMLVGFLFMPALHVGTVYSTPELALAAGNIFSYLVSPKTKLVLSLKEVVQAGFNAYDFVFTNRRPLRFQPGQYLEWTLEPAGADSRGNRRYFTIASSPTEADLRIGVKFYQPASSFKRALARLLPGQTIVASQLAGDFTMPDDQKQKLVFIAGGIGITPFRSMIKYLLDRRERREIVLFYSAKTVEELAYKEIFDAAGEAGVKVVYALTGEVPAPWSGHCGLIDGSLIAREVPDYKERLFYLSGPHVMVSAFKCTLQELGVKKSRIKTDFFPGFA